VRRWLRDGSGTCAGGDVHAGRNDLDDAGAGRRGDSVTVRRELLAAVPGLDATGVAVRVHDFRRVAGYLLDLVYAGDAPLAEAAARIPVKARFHLHLLMQAGADRAGIDRALAVAGGRFTPAAIDSVRRLDGRRQEM